MEHLRNLHRLLVDGFISPAEYDHRRQQLIDKLTNTTLGTSTMLPRNTLVDMREVDEDDYDAGEVEASQDPMPTRSSARQCPKDGNRLSSTSKRPGPLVRKMRSTTVATSTALDDEADNEDDENDDFDGRTSSAMTTTALGGLSSTTTSCAYTDSSVARSVLRNREQGSYEPPRSLVSSVEAVGPTMDLAHKYTLSRKISQLPEEALPSVLKIVEQFSPKSLRQSGEDWTFDLETLEDRTLWKLNDFVNAAIKQCYGGKDHNSYVELEVEEKPRSSTVTHESDPEDMEEDFGVNSDQEDLIDNMESAEYWHQPYRPSEELKAAKRPRHIAFGAGEKRKRKEDIKRKGKERRERERAIAAAKRLDPFYIRERESESDEGEDYLAPFNPLALRKTAEVMQSRGSHQDEAADEMEKESESEYEREQEDDPEYTSDTQLRRDDETAVNEESDHDDDSSCGGDEDDDDWEPDEQEEPKSLLNSRQLPTVKEEFTQPRPTAIKEERTSHALRSHLVESTKQESTEPISKSDKPFKIQVCIYSLAKKSNTKKPYVCDACDKQFADRSNLIQHLRVHTKEKPYGCTYEGCDKRFAHSASLKEHLHTHTGDKPHICNHPGCGMSFAQASNLRRHQVVHTGEKPFACTMPGCTKSFTQKINLSQHLKRVHKVSQSAEDANVSVRRPVKRSRSVSASVYTSSSRSTSTSSTTTRESSSASR